MNNTIEVGEICLICRQSVAFGSGKFVNRIPACGNYNEADESLEEDGYFCGDCGGYECTECGLQIYIDCEIRVEYEDENGDYHYGNYHEACYNVTKHGPTDDEYQ